MSLQILAIGEVMLELAPAGESGGKKLLALGYAGDTYNTAIYLARLGVKTGYFTRLGDDPYSSELLQLMVLEGLDIISVERVPGRAPGLYVITNQANGERNFSFWRGQSPAREMFAAQASTAALEQRLLEISYAYLSGITLGILADEARASLLRILGNFRARGGKVVFDNNYRPQLWRDRDHARSAMAAALAVADIALLTDDDEMRLWGRADEGGSSDEAEVLQRCRAAGVAEVIIKRGPAPVIVASGLSDAGYRDCGQVEVPPVAKVVDTTAAGDSFNAGYLAARLAGSSMVAAAAYGSRCAGVVIQERGAIVARDLFLAAVAAGFPVKQ